MNHTAKQAVHLWLEMIIGLTWGNSSLVILFGQFYYFILEQFWPWFAVRISSLGHIGGRLTVQRVCTLTKEILKSKTISVEKYLPLTNKYTLSLSLKIFGQNDLVLIMTPPQVPLMKNPALCNGCVWLCAEPQGPTVNITWQWEKKGIKRFFWSLIHLSPVTDKACRVEWWKDDFPWGEQEATL